MLFLLIKCWKSFLRFFQGPYSHIVGGNLAVSADSSRKAPAIHLQRIYRQLFDALERHSIRDWVAPLHLSCSSVQGQPQIQYCPTESVSLAQEEQAIGHYVLKLLWFWRSKYRRWGDDPSKMRAAHQWDLNQTSVDVEEEEGVYNKVQHAVHAMAVKERPDTVSWALKTYKTYPLNQRRGFTFNWLGTVVF